MRRTIIVVVLLSVVVVAVTVGAILALRAKLKAPPVAEIVVPEYPVPSENSFSKLVKAAEAIAADREAIDKAYDAGLDGLGPGAAALIERHRESRRMLREALVSECLQPRPVDMNQEFKYLRHFRTSARLLVVKGWREEQVGQRGIALQSYRDALRLAPVAARNGSVLHGLLGIALTTMTAPEMARCIGSQKLTEAKLEKLAAFLEQAWEDRVPWHETLAIEWSLIDRTLREYAKGNFGRGNGEEAAKLPSDPVGRRIFTWFFYDRSRAECARYMTAKIEDARKPLWEQTHRAPKPKTMLAEIILPVFGRATAKVAQRDALLQGLRTQAAIELFRMQRGGLPETLSELTPDYLAEVPPDPYDGKPFRYQRTEDAYVLYSVGPDRADAAGKRPMNWRTRKGDLIIWPSGEADSASPPGPLSLATTLGRGGEQQRQRRRVPAEAGTLL